MDVRPGREIFKVTCGASDPTSPEARCLLQGGHPGNMHWDTVTMHGWFVDGAEIPSQPPINRSTLQCPNCKFVFPEIAAIRGATITIGRKPWVEAP